MAQGESCASVEGCWCGRVIRDYDKDYDKAYMDSFYRENVIRYLKYKMPKSEFKKRFKNEE